MPKLRWLAVWGLLLQAGVAAADDSLWPSDRPLASAAAEKPVAEPIVPRTLGESKSPAATEAALPTDPKSPEAVFAADAITPACPEPLCHIKFGAYGWLPEMYGQVGIRDVTTDFGVTTRDMLNLLEHNVHFIFAGQMEANAGRWTATSTGLYIYAGYGNSIRRLNFSGNASLAIVDGALAYEVATVDWLPLLPATKVEILAGGRYWLLGGTVSITGPFGNTVTRGNDVQWVDPVVGGRLTCAINDTTTFKIRGDIGGWGWWNASDDTWNVEAVLEKRCSKCCTIAAGYRILDVDYTRNSHERFVFDAQMRGPVSTLTFEF